MANIKPYAVDVRIILKSGKQKNVGIQGEVTFDQNKNPVLIRGSVTDITEGKQVEESLQASEEKFRSLAENCQDYIMRYDREFRHTYMNPAGLKVSGFTEKDIIGKTHRETGFDEKLCDLWEDKIKTLFKTGEPSQTIFEWNSAERLFPEVDSSGRERSVFAISRDITELKRAEEERLSLERQMQQAQKLESPGVLAGGIAHDVGAEIN